MQSPEREQMANRTGSPDQAWHATPHPTPQPNTVFLDPVQDGRQEGSPQKFGRRNIGPTEHEALYPGDPVRAQYLDGLWYNGWVHQFDPNNAMYQIHWEDGSYSDGVPREQIELLVTASGSQHGAMSPQQVTTNGEGPASAAAQGVVVSPVQGTVYPPPPDETGSPSRVNS